MSWIGSLWKRNHPPGISPDDFGRYSDAYKPPEKYDAWESSLTLFDEGRRFAAYQKFFEYLRNPGNGNIKVRLLHGRIEFELTQGTQIVKGTIDAQKVHAKATLAGKTSYAPELLRELLEENYNLKFCKYALSGKNELILAAHASVKATSPYKLFHLLRETALTADKKDDLIYSKYGLANPVAESLKVDLPHEKREALYHFIRRRIKNALNLLKTGPLSPEEYPGTARYVLLAAAYKIDFLTVPEGVLMDELEAIDHVAFGGQTKDSVTDNGKIIAALERILDFSKEQLLSCLYRTHSTFGINPVIRSSQIRDTIFSEIPTIEWYLGEGFEDYSIAVTDFVIGYLLFNYSVPPPCKALFLLYFRLREPALFKSLGYKDPLAQKNKPLPRLIRSEIRQITKFFRKEFPYLEPELGLLEFDTMPRFYKSFLEMITELNFTKAG